MNSLHASIGSGDCHLALVVPFHRAGPSKVRFSVRHWRKQSISLLAHSALVWVESGGVSPTVTVAIDEVSLLQR